MLRPVLVGLLASLVLPSAAMAKGPEVCILQATETITSPRKPNLFTMKMDCGSDPTHEQQTALSLVSTSDNTPDVLSHLLGLGYSVASATTMVSYTGNSVISTYTLAKAPMMEAGMPGTMANPSMMPSSTLPEALDDLPEAEDDEVMDDSEESEDDMLDLGGDDAE